MRHGPELGLSLHGLGPQRRLDAVEQAFKPPDQLGLRHPDLGLAGDLVERVSEGRQLSLEILRQRAS